MNRFYLEEDLQQIQKYFPDAEPVTIRTPFDLTERPGPAQSGTACHPSQPAERPWYGTLLPDITA